MAINLQQVKADLEGNVSVCLATWAKVLEVAIEQQKALHRADDFLCDIDLLDHPDAGDHNSLCQGGSTNATVLDNIMARARELRAAVTAAGAA